MYALRRSTATLARSTVNRVAARSFSRAVAVRQATPTKEDHSDQPKGLEGYDKEIFTMKVPGFRAPGQIPTNWELASGKERYEYLHRLAGTDPFPDMTPIYLDSRPTTKSPYIIRGSDPERYVGCTGFPADSHEVVWLTVREHKGFDRCPHCGNVFKYEREHHHHEGDGHH